MGLHANPDKNGLTGTLLDSVDEDRWQVRFDGGAGRWAVRAAHLEKLHVPRIRPGEDRLSIAGTWTDWAMREMTWKPEGGYFYFEVQLGTKGEESFQVVINGDWKGRLYPDQADSCPHATHTLCGPDGTGEGKNWTIGRHPLDQGRSGSAYRIRLFLTDDGHARAVDWLRLAVPLGSYHSISIAGTWDNWQVHSMTQDSEQSQYSFTVELGKNGWESFQILLDGEWSKCIHPDRADSCPHVDYNLCGPDESGHWKNWTIGRHTLDHGAVGARYLVRLHLLTGACAARVDWVPFDAGASEEVPVTSADVQEAVPPAEAGASEAEAASCPAAAAACKSAFIVGSWNSWALQQMDWDSGRLCYHCNVQLGSSGQESFQIVIDSDWKKCLHPDRPDGRTDSVLCGPDDQGHGKNWTIGLNPQRKGAAGDRYEVVLRLTGSSSFAGVDWSLLS